MRRQNLRSNATNAVEGHHANSREVQLCYGFYSSSQVRVHMNEVSRMPFHTQNSAFSTGPIPVAPYLSQKQFDAEISEIFRKDWLWVARDEELPNPGDYKVKRLDFANTSVIVMRGKDGKVRAFHNVCRHRGNKVITESGEETFGSSKAAVVTCRFHGWVYGADGSLVDVPEQQKFPPCFDKTANGLIPIAAADTPALVVSLAIFQEDGAVLNQEYAALAKPLVQEYQGETVAFGTGVPRNYATLFWENAVLFKFPTAAAFENFYTDPRYQHLIETYRNRTYAQHALTMMHPRKPRVNL